MVYLQGFKPPKRPFRRMTYVEALDYLKEHDIKKDDGTYYEFGDVSNVISQKQYLSFWLLGLGC